MVVRKIINWLLSDAEKYIDTPATEKQLILIEELHDEVVDLIWNHEDDENTLQDIQDILDEAVDNFYSSNQTKKQASITIDFLFKQKEILEINLQNG